ncbi:MAG: hypothetical protein KAS30_02055, partial [Candidatus Diapherotrites archaeon]|nr:hypothetical protein [Candidatus Diapherotrites archaeon]
GETSSNGIVPKCKNRGENEECIEPGEYRISYTAVATKAIPMTLLPATMEYENIFGEKEEMLSNRPSFEAIEREDMLSVQTTLNTDSILAGEEILIKIKLNNQGKTNIEHINLKLITGLEVIGEKSRILSLEPGHEITAEFKAKGITAGNYTIGCEAIYGETVSQCVESTLKIENSGLGKELLAGIAFLLVALAVFTYFLLKK